MNRVSLRSEKCRVLIPHPLLGVIIREGIVSWKDRQSKGMNNSFGITLSHPLCSECAGYGAFGTVYRLGRSYVVYVGVHDNNINNMDIVPALRSNPFMSRLLPLPIGMARFEAFYLMITPYLPSKGVDFRAQVSFSDSFYRLFLAIARQGFRSYDAGVQNFGLAQHGIVGYDTGSYKLIKKGMSHAEQMFLHWFFHSGLFTYQDVLDCGQFIREEQEELIVLVKRQEWKILEDYKRILLPLSAHNYNK